jgi:hypothetical protein
LLLRAVAAAGTAAEPHAPRAQDVANGYPLRIEAQKVETREVEFNAGAWLRRAALQPQRAA